MSLISKLEKNSSYLKIIWNDGEESKFNYLWLRDNCPSAFHKDTRMRNFNILSVSKKIMPINFKFNKKKLYISWSEDNHKSIYNLKWLRENCYTEKNLKSYKSSYKLWDAKFSNKIKLVVFDYKKIISNEKELTKWLRAIHSFGITIVEE